MLQAVRASPGAKAATLSRESQALTHAVRAQLDGQCIQGDAEVGALPSKPFSQQLEGICTKV